jgi:rhamnulokinase
MTRQYLALDLGAESGRAVLGRFDGNVLTYEELRRFPNQPVRLPGALHWDILSLYREVLQSIDSAPAGLDSVAIDTWGVDFGLLDGQGDLLANPVHYRDSRTDGMLELAERLVGQARIFDETGIQITPINTLYQLLSLRGSAVLNAARTLLTIPDLLTYWLSGVAVAEFTIATTTQCYDPRAGDWAVELLDALEIPTRIFPRVVAPGSVLGSLRSAPSTRVVAPAAHDTASAVAGTPLASESDAYISSGTWSLVGIEVPAPIINSAALAANITNEGGVGGTYRLLRNVMGLWLVQGIRAELSYDELVEAAERAGPSRAWIDPDATELLHPLDMAAALRSACAASGQPAPDDVGGLVRMVFESLALRYRWVIEQLQSLTGQAITTIHVVGGGARNTLLCQLTADATGCIVRTGPVEATAIGNVVVQAIAAGELKDLREARELVRRCVSQAELQPHPSERWEEAYARFLSVIQAA